MNLLRSENGKAKIQAGLISAFLTFTIFIFGPIEAYINNQDEFWFGLNSLLGLIVGGAIICYLTVYFTLLRINKKYNRYVIAIILGLALSLYIQGNFMFVKYGVLDGSKIEWNSYGNWGIYNTALWIVGIIIPIIIAKKLTRWFYNFSCCISAFLITIQAVTLITLIFSVGIGTKNNITVNTAGIFDVSKNKNIAIFVVDTMDAQYFQSVMEAYPEVEDVFADFTYYANTMGLYPTTKAALPQILTGSKYQNEMPYDEYIQDAWEKSFLIKELNATNFSYGIYTLTPFISPQADLVNLENKKPIVKSQVKLYKEYEKFILFRYVPHVLKRYFIVTTDSFEELKASGETAGLYSMKTDFLDELLLNKGIHITSQNIFRVYHYAGSHPPYTLDENLNEVGEEKSSPVKQTRGSLKLVEDYIKLLKEEDCYENSMIVVMADHGGEDLRQHPALLIKYPQQNHAFRVSDASISYTDLMATFISGVTDNYSPYGESIADLDNQGLSSRKREYLFYNWDDSWDKRYLPDMKQYLSTKQADELSGEDFTNVIYTEEGTVAFEPVQYNWEREFSFLDEGDRQSVLEGISGLEEGHNSSWSLGYKTVIQMNLPNKPQRDVLLSLNIPYIFGEEQRMKIFINDTFVEEKVLTSGDDDLKAIIPQNIMYKGINKIRFEYPEAKSPQEVLNTPDPRILAVALKSLKLSEHLR